MPDPVQPPVAPSGTLPPSSTPLGTTGGAPNGAPPASAPAANWRAPDGAPAWARGKTPEEILGIANTLVDMYERGGAPAAPAPVALPDAPVIADDDYINGAQLKAMLARRPDNSAEVVNLAASASYGVIRQQHAATFAKYGAEIESKLARVPRNLWTIDNLETVVKMVRSDHVDEIAHERAQQIVSGMPPTLRSNGAPASDVAVPREYSLESEKIPAEWKRRAAEAGVTERVVEEFCRSNDMTPADFYKQFDTPLNRIVEDHGATRGT